jgi:DNA-directed RNA polymerase specialized sigma24 family protein
VLAWLTSIVRRTALGAGRVKARGMAKETPDADGGVGAGNISSSTPVGLAMRTLTDRQRQVIELSYYRGLTIGQIATQLGEPETGTRELLRSAMQQLRSALPSDGLFEHHVVTPA